MKACIRLLVVAVIGFGVVGTYGDRAAQPQAPAKAQKEQTISPDQAWQRLKAGNNRFVDEMNEKPNLSAGRRRELSNGQSPFAVVLTCADSRLAPEYIFNQGLGDLFVVRVAGNISEPFALGSIEYAVEHVHVPLIVLLGHEKCGAVEAALGKEKPAGNLGKLIAEIDVGADLPRGNEAALATAISNNARRHTRLLTERSEVIKHHVEKKEVKIVCGIYQLASGKVEWLDYR
jgi:carbonic anhydrase